MAWLFSDAESRYSSEAGHGGATHNPSIWEEDRRFKDIIDHRAIQSPGWVNYMNPCFQKQKESVTCVCAYTTAGELQTTGRERGHWRVMRVWIWAKHRTRVYKLGYKVQRMWGVVAHIWDPASGLRKEGCSGLEASYNSMARPCLKTPKRKMGEGEKRLNISKKSSH